VNYALRVIGHTGMIGQSSFPRRNRRMIDVKNKNQMRIVILFMIGCAAFTAWTSYNLLTAYTPADWPEWAKVSGQMFGIITGGVVGFIGSWFFIDLFNNPKDNF
jgi:hypothetical protein